MKKVSVSVLAALAFGFFPGAYAQQCNDGVDNDGDGRADYYSELSATNGLRFTYGTGTTAAEEFFAHIAQEVVRKKLPVTAPAHPIVRSDGSREGGENLHMPTLTKVCQILGYANFESSTCNDSERSSRYPSGKCNYHTPENNFLSRFNGTNFVAESAVPKLGKTWLTGITCRDRLAACRDGWDNDGDGLVDFPADPGCNNANDDSELTHDVACGTNAAGVTETKQCANGVDDDADGVTDASDPGCWTDKNNPATYDRFRHNEGAATTQCQDNADNDSDGVVDASDPGCWTDKNNPATFSKIRNNEGAATTQCQDGVDNDGDGVSDATDPGCWTDKNNPATFSKIRNDEGAATTQCQDSVDNDGDGVADAADPGCWTDKNNPATFSKIRNDEAAATTQCQDGLDNDADSTTDSADPGCFTDKNNPATFDKTRNNEGAAAPQCQDGIDNDADGVSDANDPGCWSDKNNPATFDKTRNNEGAATTQCQDGVDNDSDGVVDASDPGCWTDKNNPSTYSKTRNNEGAATTQCQDGVDNDGDGVADASDPGCWKDKTNPSSFDKTLNNEGAATTGCQDTIDNDGDGLIDRADPGCWSDPSNPSSYDKTRNNEGAATTACQDKIDNDGDGLVDLADPGCTNAQDANETDEVSKLQVSVDCVYDNGDGTFTAYFGYENLLGSAAEVVTDVAKGTENSFSPAPAVRQQTTAFQVGRKKGAFGVPFNGEALTWTVKIVGGGKSSATASRTSTACKQVEPVAECIDSDTKGLKGTFGYVNSNEFEVKVGLGAKNAFDPAPADRGQPTSFFPGTVKSAFSASFTDALTWTLGGGKAVANSSLALCPGGCLGTSTVEVKGQLDSVALKLAGLANEAAKFITRQADSKLPKVKADKIKRDAARARKKADELVKIANSLLVEFPAVVKTCPNSAATCKTVDRNATITQLKEVYAKLRGLTKRLYSRGTFAATGKTSRMNKVVEEAKSTEAAGLVSLADLPRFATECE